MRIGLNIVRLTSVTQTSVPQDEFVARLVVGQEGVPTSGTLRIWSPPGKSDIYAAMRGIAGECKVSLHASGECLAGLTKQFARKESDAVNTMGGSRHQSKWTRATHAGSRVITPPQFVIPASELQTFSSKLPLKFPKRYYLGCPAGIWAIGHHLVPLFGSGGPRCRMAWTAPSDALSWLEDPAERREVLAYLARLSDWRCRTINAHRGKCSHGTDKNGAVLRTRSKRTCTAAPDLQRVPRGTSADRNGCRSI